MSNLGNQRIFASGSFDGTDAGAFADPGSVVSPRATTFRDWTVARAGVGDYTVTFGANIGLGERAVLATSRTAAVMVTVGAETLNTVQFLCENPATAAAAEADLYFEVTRNAG